MAFEFKLTHRVAFAETDMAGIVHFSNFFRYMENTEHAFYRSLGWSVIMSDLDPPLGFRDESAQVPILNVSLNIGTQPSVFRSYFIRAHDSRDAGDHAERNIGNWVFASWRGCRRCC